MTDDANTPLALRSSGPPLLSVHNLHTYFPQEEGTVKAVDGVSFDLYPGRTLGIVGESGCGKSMTARSILRIVDRPGRIVAGEIRFRRRKQLDANSDDMRAVRGAEIALVFQEPMSSFSPVHTIGNQIVEAILLHQKVSKRQARARAIEVFRDVGIPLPEQRLDAYAHQLSGGLRQRAMIAMALVCNPSLLIADEPTTALDVTTQAQILDLLRHLQQEYGMAIMLITHDLGVIAEMADDVVVMYLGRVVEHAPVDELFHAPKHPYTQALLRSIPHIRSRPRERLASVAGSVPDLQKLFPIRKGFWKRTVGHVRAVDGVSFTLNEGETLGLVGESGCGKTTTARCILQALKPTQGQILFRTEAGAVVDVATLDKTELRALRREMQMVFQDPFTSLNPRMTLLDIVGEPLRVHGMKKRREREARVAELLRLVGLRAEYMRRFPHAFSGGERQRIGIARAFALHPRLVIADEPVSALDVSVQAQILNLLLDLQTELRLTYLFVAHDLSVVKHISDRVAVMYVGQLVELAPTEQLFMAPKHPYTDALLSAVPEPDPRQRTRRIVLQGEVANPADPPSGCYFHPRCPHAIEVCRTQAPTWEEVAPQHFARCHRAHELQLIGVEEVARTT
ncbi:Glutathione import ATP-binding protein GsiA [Geodia barretti]|uniref:Glutathione import ATP-binding protein GsiA n=1 Tax=Geodia barretti TaxID=519541 RepID=A0AA35SIX2_GEOBA|nr:Glutathione import ATP-binding protein GsiA [Geodia barretti]